MKVLEKYLTRDVPLIAIESWYEGRIKYFKNFFGISFPQTVFWSTKGVFEWYIDLTDFDYKFPRRLAVWSRSVEHRKKLPLVHQYMREGLDYFRSLKTHKTTNSIRLIEYVRRCKELLAHGYAGVLVSHHFPRWNNQFRKKGKKLFNPSLIKEIMKWRAAEGNIFLDHGSSTVYALLHMIANSKKWNPDLLKYITLRELDAAVRLKTSFPTAKLKKRQKTQFVFLNGKILYEPNLNKKLKVERLKLKIDASSDKFLPLKGTVASRGNAKGKVKVIFSRSQLSLIKRGEILVAPMTAPWYLPAMKKALAIVTDEGGVASHAAIISRELKIPSVVGTKIATKILQDGDLVEVDANKGVVRILRKA